MISELIKKNRSVRRFQEEVTVDNGILRDLVELARFSASAGNSQPLKYVLVCDPRVNALVFQHLAWASYLRPWTGPAKGERPSAYIIILGDTEVSKVIDCDHGIAAQSILLGATEKGLAGCIVGSIERHGLQKVMGIPARYDILLVIALGKPKEEVILEAAKDNDIRYWRDAAGVHHVPKRALDDIIVLANPDID